MPPSRKRPGPENVADLKLEALRVAIPRRVIGALERHAIVTAVNGLMDGAFARLDQIVAEGRRWRRSAKVETCKGLFGLDRPDSSLMTPRLAWKMSLSERIATETLARLLNAGGHAARAARVEAFLRALGLGDKELGAGPGKLTGCQAQSEEPAGNRRIDLKILWHDAGGRECVLIVEAKFEHVLTEGQLRCYRDATKAAHRGTRRFQLVLALHEDVRQSVKRRDGIWMFCTWREFWLRFEAGRPVEQDLNLQLFLHALWRRIGQLRPEDAYAAL